MRRPRFIYLCNAIDEATCRERGITSDSPAATQKVLQVTGALRRAGLRTVVLSLGRGRQNATGRYYPARVKRVGGLVLIYAPFLDRPLLTHLISLLGLIPLLIRLRQPPLKPVILAYNRLVHYWPGLELARWLGFRCFLDLEDGMIAGEGSRFRQCIAQFMASRFNKLCQAGAVLAASCLAQQFAGTRTCCCYGVASLPGAQTGRAGAAGPLVVHLGGTLQEATGSCLLAAAIRCLRAMPAPPDIRFVVTGSGPGGAELAALAEAPGLPAVTYLGKVSRETYLQVIGGAHVGLSLKLASGDQANTTFPSKVIEIASTGMTLLSTRMSDVPALFREDGAIFLDTETPAALAAVFVRMAAGRAHLPGIAARGQAYVLEACSAERVGSDLKDFLFGEGCADSSSNLRG